MKLLSSIILVTAIVMAHLAVIKGQQQAPENDNVPNSATQNEIKDELSHIDVDAAIELTEQNVEGSKLLDSISGSPDFMAGQDVANSKDAAKEIDNVFLEA